MVPSQVNHTWCMHKPWDVGDFKTRESRQLASTQGIDMKKTFLVAGPDGAKTIEAEQLATFAHYIQNIQYRFVVTRVPGNNTIGVTHRNSGKRVCAIPYGSVTAAVNDYKVAGVAALQDLIGKVGEARVASALRAAE